MIVCFAIRRGEAHWRLDVIYNNPITEKTPVSKYPLEPLKRLLDRTVSGGTPLTTEKDFWGGEIPWVSPKDFGESEISTTSDLITASGRLAAGLELLPIESVLLVVRSGILLHTLPVAINVVPVTINQDLKALIPNNRIAPRYLAEYLHVFQAKLLPLICKHGTTVQSVNTVELNRTLIPIPPMKVQIALATQLQVARSTRDAKRLNAEELLAGMDAWIFKTIGIYPPKEEKRLTFSIKRRSAVERLDPHFHSPQFEKLMRSLDNVRCERLSQVIQFSHEYFTHQLDPSSLFRYIEISGINIKTGEVTASNVLTSEAPSRARMLVRAGDLLVSLTRPHRGAIAMTGIELDGSVASTGFAVLRKINESLILPDCLLFLLRSELCKLQMLQRSSGGNYPAITEEELGKVLIPIPEKEVQLAIVNEAHRRRTEARRLRTEAEAEWAVAKLKFEQALLG
jgi:type I restriction enzyme S subunit